ncbi:MAG: family 78 glycoside hydrolase catalytic domain, partial [Acidimicrobiales bacterium]
QEPVPLRNNEGSNREEHIDGRLYPNGWDLATYDASSWAPVYVIGPHPIAPWTQLVSQSTRIVENPVHPVSVKRVLGNEYVADFGTVIAGRPNVVFHNGATGRSIDIRAGFLLDPNGEVSTTRGTQATDMSYQYTERTGAQFFRSYGYLGFRYLEIDNPGEVLSPSEITIYARHSAVPDQNASSFSSSNGTLNSVWRVASHSAFYGSQDTFVDTPTREQTQFLRDAFNTSSTTMRAFGERNLTQQALLDFAQSQARFWPDGRLNALYPTDLGALDIPDFTEVFPEWVWQYYLDTGDRQMLQTMYPVITNISNYVARYMQPQTGLVANLAGGTPGSDEFGAVDANAATFDGYQFAYYNTTVNELGV